MTRTLSLLLLLLSPACVVTEPSSGNAILRSELILEFDPASQRAFDRLPEPDRTVTLARIWDHATAMLPPGLLSEFTPKLVPAPSDSSAANETVMNEFHRHRRAVVRVFGDDPEPVPLGCKADLVMGLRWTCHVTALPSEKQQWLPDVPLVYSVGLLTTIEYLVRRPEPRSMAPRRDVVG